VTLRKGRYTYLCDPHATNMHGTFRVTLLQDGAPRNGLQAPAPIAGRGITRTFLPSRDLR